MDGLSAVVQVIYDSIDHVNTIRESNQALEKSPETLLAGESAGLDSLGFVNLTVAIEENIEEKFGQQISVVDLLGEIPEGQFTVAALAKCILEQLGEEPQEP